MTQKRARIIRAIFYLFFLACALWLVVAFSQILASAEALDPAEYHDAIRLPFDASLWEQRLVLGRTPCAPTALVCYHDAFICFWE